MINPIICKNDIKIVINQLQVYLEKNRTLNCIHVVDISDDQVVVLIGNEHISEEYAKIWWSGYKAALA